MLLTWDEVEQEKLSLKLNALLIIEQYIDLLHGVLKLRLQKHIKQEFHLILI